jgi:putative methyltransferase (TIGR04325 family)
MTTEHQQTVVNQIYANYNDALSVCNGKGYSMQDLTDVVVKKNIAMKHSLTRDSYLSREATRTLMSIGFALNSKSVRILDFGGGGGYHYTLARLALGEECRIKWNIVETEAMCHSARIIADDSLKFFSTISAAEKDLGCVDLLLTSSALQYCPDPIAYLKDLLAVSAKYLYITRTPFFPGQQTLVSVQSSMLSHNGPGPLPDGYTDQEILYPISYVPLDQIETLIQEKYTIRFKVLEEPGNLFIDNQAVNAYYGFFCELK